MQRTGRGKQLRSQDSSERNLLKKPSEVSDGFSCQILPVQETGQPAALMAGWPAHTKEPAEAPVPPAGGGEGVQRDESLWRCPRRAGVRGGAPRTRSKGTQGKKSLPAVVQVALEDQRRRHRVYRLPMLLRPLPRLVQDRMRRNRRAPLIP